MQLFELDVLQKILNLYTIHKITTYVQTNRMCSSYKRHFKMFHISRKFQLLFIISYLAQFSIMLCQDYNAVVCVRDSDLTLVKEARYLFLNTFKGIRTLEAIVKNWLELELKPSFKLTSNKSLKRNVAMWLCVITNIPGPALFVRYNWCLQ